MTKPAPAPAPAAPAVGGPSAAVRVAVSLACGALTAAVVALIGPVWLVPLSAWDVTGVVFVGWMWSSIWSLDPSDTAARARCENPGRAAADVLLLCASVVSLLAVGLVLVQAGKLHGLEKGLLVGMGVASVVLGWAVVHTIFTLRYAKLYYGSRSGGIDFNEDDEPDYADFAYLALTIGMTFQVSDTDLQTKEIRRTALRHALLSYIFGALIIATTINLIAGLGK